jgi:hypothetical protein
MTTTHTADADPNPWADLVIVPVLVQLPAEYAKNCIWAATRPRFITGASS